MVTVPLAVSDMLVTVKSREIQRAVLAEMRGDMAGRMRHFLAAAHLELVLADDYDHVVQPDLARRSRLSAVSCLWRVGRIDQARELLEELQRTDPHRAAEVQQVLAELDRDYPPEQT